MPHEIANQIALEAPIAHDVAEQLQRDYGVDPDRLESAQKAQRIVLEAEYGNVETMLALSTPASLDPVVGYDDDPEIPETEFAQQYELIRHDPLAKMHFDSKTISDLMRKLGPTNTLRRPDGLDASFELARMLRLLQNDYNALPDEEKRPGLRMTEAILSEELALLWSPRTPMYEKRAAEIIKPLVANVNDVNVPDTLQETLSDKDRWKLVGAQLAADATAVFQDIAHSDTTDVGLKFEAICRAADMKIRQLQILSSMTSDNGQKQEFKHQLEQVARTTLGRMTTAWLDPIIRRQVGRDKLYEMLVVVTERDKLLRAGLSRRLVRLALPREDIVHERIGMIPYRGGVINLSTDVVVEDISTGEFVTSYQAKAMSEQGYKRKEADRVKQGGIPIEYAVSRVALHYAASDQAA